MLMSVLLCVVLIPLSTLAQSHNEPVIDMHLHADHVDSQGPPPIFICAPFSIWPTRDPKTGGDAYGMSFLKHPPCESPLQSASTDEEMMRRTLKIMQLRNVTALASGPPDIVAKWREAGGDRILPATPFDPKSGKPTVAELRQLVKNGQVVAFAEIGQQYEGIAANDPRMEPYYALAEELDVPVGIHMGPGPPGATYFFAPNYRMRFSSLLILEDVLARHPKLRLWAMHAGWPLGDDAIATLYAHPQLYVDIGIIDYAFPRKEFYGYLQRLIDAGFEKRIMFGSDEMVWPDALAAAIDSIQNAPSLTSEQKRDILYNNAARFLRLKQ
ncbi:MAG TPA: amidohydrolase family protein [Candidatus Acidoferrales bacterium]|nr:amidohydrolase family protein [Candidatus Acidoferrales bacterium]